MVTSALHQFCSVYKLAAKNNACAFVWQNVCATPGNPITVTVNGIEGMKVKDHCKFLFVTTAFDYTTLAKLMLLI